MNNATLPNGDSIQDGQNGSQLIDPKTGNIRAVNDITDLTAGRGIVLSVSLNNPEEKIMVSEMKGFQLATKE